MPTLTRQNMLDIIAAGGVVGLWPGVVLRTAGEVPTQAQLDAGLYDSPVPPAFMPRPNTRRSALLQANGANNVTVFGDGAAQAGTASTIAIAAAAPWVMTNYATAATLNAQAYVQGFAIHLWSRKPLAQFLVAPGASVAVVRYWVGLCSAASATILGTDSPHTVGQYFAGFRFSTSAADAGWTCVTSDGVATTTTPSGVAATASVPRRFELSDNGVATTFKIDGAVVATHSANRPAAAGVMQMLAAVQTLEAVAKSVSCGWEYMEAD